MTQFVTKGDLPLTPAQLEKRAQKWISRSWNTQAREKSIRLADGAFDAFMASFSADHDVNVARNTFNWQLLEYRKATARLARYRLADGRAEVTEVQVIPGAFDPLTGDPLTGTVVIAPHIEAVDPTVSINTYDAETGDVTGTQEVENPVITADNTERASAQAVVDATPQEVKDFDTTT